MKNGPSDHVEDEQLVRLACNEVDAAERIEIVAHLEQCAACAEVWQAVEHVQKAAVAFDPGAPQPTSAHRFGQRRAVAHAAWLGLAAAAVLAIGLATWLKTPRPAADLPRIAAHHVDPTATHVVRRSPDTLGPRPLTPEEASRVHNPTFSWEGAEDAVAFTVELLDSEGNVLWTSARTTERTMPWPSAVEQKPVEQKPGTYYWRVFAHFEDGQEPAPSPLVSFALIGP